MKRLTTDNPQLNMQTALNLFYVKDGQAFLRGYGDPTGETDISILDMMRQIMQKNDLITGPFTDEEVSEIANAWLTDGQLHDIETISALLYTAGWAFAEIRCRLKLLEDILGDNYDPSNLRHLVEADRNGWIPPLYVGQTVYVLSHEGVDEEKVVGIISDGKTIMVEISHFLGVYEYSEKNFGAWVFLSRESAEQALEKLDGRPAL